MIIPCPSSCGFSLNRGAIVGTEPRCELGTGAPCRATVGTGAPCRATCSGYAWWCAGMLGARGTGYDKWETCVLRAWGLRDSVEGYIMG